MVNWTSDTINFFYQNFFFYVISFYLLTQFLRHFKATLKFEKNNNYKDLNFKYVILFQFFSFLMFLMFIFSILSVELNLLMLLLNLILNIELSSFINLTEAEILNNEINYLKNQLNNCNVLNKRLAKKIVEMENEIKEKNE